MTTCDYEGCSEPIRDEDKDLSEGAKKYCQRHGAEIDAILKSGSPSEIMKWWLESMTLRGKEVHK